MNQTKQTFGAAVRIQIGPQVSLELPAPPCAGSTTETPRPPAAAVRKFRAAAVPLELGSSACDSRAPRRMRMRWECSAARARRSDRARSRHGPRHGTSARSESRVHVCAAVPASLLPCLRAEGLTRRARHPPRLGVASDRRSTSPASVHCALHSPGVATGGRAPPVVARAWDPLHFQALAACACGSGSAVSCDDREQSPSGAPWRQCCPFVGRWSRANVASTASTAAYLSAKSVA
ncbi:hypothetical protein FA95DRAFT_672515 [Auriscalpium vulgare]|uniref:Uncharacterized protein n=1 Tax=Auriscalpium vulgare TaxID=40419 RepID=A0ACB8RBU7_9AGAM|nr:hypothetical protein FA95DRAFT_672515 [Auriscalpium vulgare]